MLILPVVLLLTAATVSAQSTIYVPKDYPTIQQAIDAAENGDEIIVAPGVYWEAINTLGKAIHLRSSDGPDDTFIDTDQMNATVVTIDSGEGPETIIEGFSIANGTGTEALGGITLGGGMLIHDASPTVINCSFNSNSATYGGAIEIENGSPMIDGCTFIVNEATFGGAVAVFDAAAAISNSAFTDNAASVGGALYLGYLAGDSSITGCGFQDNHASFRGGAIHIDDRTPVIEQSSFTGNAAWQGGGISIVSAKPSIVGGTFTSNHGEDAGGGIYNESAGTWIVDCMFDGNSTSPKMPPPPPTFVGGGAISNWWGATPTIEGSTFINNISSMDGGAILYRDGSHVTIRDSTFGNNAADGHGGALAGDNHVDLVIENSYFDGASQTESSSNVIRCRDECLTTISGSTFADFDDSELVPVLLLQEISSELHIENTTFENNGVLLVAHTQAQATTINGSTFANNIVGFGPALIVHTSSAGPLQLSNTLFCGTDGENFSGSWKDLWGNEFLETCPWSVPGDLNGDGSIDGADLLILLGDWGECDDPDNCPGDLNGDGMVNGADLLVLLASWG